MRTMSARPADYLRVWFSQVDFVERAGIDGGTWLRGEKVEVSRQTAGSCARFGWIERSKVVVAEWHNDAAFYMLTKTGTEAIQGLPDGAFVSAPGPKKPSMRGESARILRALAARHDRQRGWIFLAEAPIDGTNVDAWAINCFASQGHRRVGYEIKVSRSDFTSELRQPAKTARSARFASEFYFACPNGLIKSAEVPDPYGLVHVKPNGRTRIVKRSKLPKSEPTWGLVGRLMRRLAQMEEGVEP
jgi:hypothetical protein